jgi:hypothetical protein
MLAIIYVHGINSQSISKIFYYYLRQQHSWDTELVTLPSKGKLLLELFLFLFKFFIIFSEWFSCVSLLEMLLYGSLLLFHHQCSGSVTFWYGSGSADPYH